MLGARLLILLGCIAAAAHWVAVFAHARRDAQRRRLLMRGCGTGRCGTADETAAETGISVLCSGCDGIEQVERLLDTEYARYETVLALDAAACPELFETLVSRYRMIRVNPACCGTIRGLYRSRQRGYRRLVIVDRTGGTSYDDFDAAAAVAAHDYLLPLPHGCRLRPDAAERLATELAAAPDGAPELIVSRLGEPIRLVGREVAAREGVSDRTRAGACGANAAARSTKSWPSAREMPEASAAGASRRVPCCCSEPPDARPRGTAGRLRFPRRRRSSSGPPAAPRRPWRPNPRRTPARSRAAQEKAEAPAEKIRDRVAPGRGRRTLPPIRTPEPKHMRAEE